MKKNNYKQAIPFIVIIAFWYLVSSLKLVDPIFLPSFKKVIQSFITLFNADFILNQLLPSFKRVMGAFLISTAIALPTGILCGISKRISGFIEPLFSFIRYLPVAAMVPLTILWFGIDDSQKIAVITIGIVFQLTLLVALAIKAVPKELIETGIIMKLSKLQLVFKIILPYSMPAIWDSLRISAGWAWSYLVLSELVAGSRGIGYFIVQSQRYLQIENVFAGIIYIGVLGLLTDLFFRLIEMRFFKWK
jgi:NitT/TauT family transport system permease protein